MKKQETMWDGHFRTIIRGAHNIELDGPSRPVNVIPYRAGSTMWQFYKVKIYRMMTSGVIEPANPEWISSIVMVSQKNGSLRICVD